MPQGPQPLGLLMGGVTLANTKAVHFYPKKKKKKKILYLSAKAQSNRYIRHFQLTWSYAFLITTLQITGKPTVKTVIMQWIEILKIFSNTSKIDSPCASTVNLVATMALHPYPKISKDIKCKDVYYDSWWACIQSNV